MAMSKVNEIVLPDDLIVPEVELIGIDSNAMTIIATVASALRRVGNSREVVNGFREEAMSGDYDHLLRVAMSYSEQPESYE